MRRTGPQRCRYANASKMLTCKAKRCRPQPEVDGLGPYAALPRLTRERMRTRHGSAPLPRRSATVAVASDRSGASAVAEPDTLRIEFAAQRLQLGPTRRGRHAKEIRCSTAAPCQRRCSTFNQSAIKKSEDDRSHDTVSKACLGGDVPRCESRFTNLRNRIDNFDQMTVVEQRGRTISAILLDHHGHVDTMTCVTIYVIEVWT